RADGACRGDRGPEAPGPAGGFYGRHAAVCRGGGRGAGGGPADSRGDVWGGGEGAGQGDGAFDGARGGAGGARRKGSAPGVVARVGALFDQRGRVGQGGS